MAAYKKHSIKLSIFTMFFIVVSLSGCFSHWQGDLAQLVISFGGAERKVYDPYDTETHNNLEHEVVLTSGTRTLTFIKSGTTFEAYVTPGEWNITVNSWIDGEIYATGSKDVTLRLGLNNITIDMEQVIFWWVWDSSLSQGGFDSTTRVTITPIADRSGYDVNVEGVPNAEYYNWVSQVGRNYIATAGKTYRASWKWKTTDNKPFNKVTVRYTQEIPPDDTDILYEFDTNANKLTIPTIEQEKIYEFTMPENGNTQYNPYFAFLVGEDTGSFRIWDFRIEEVQLPSSIKRITFTHNKGINSNDESYDNWLGFYDIPSSVRGDKINSGDVFTFNYTFTSDVTVEKDDWAMSIVLVDNSATAEPQYWKELSDYYPLHRIRAEEAVNGTITLTAAETASSSSAEANRLAFIINTEDAGRHPTLTFTKFEFTKAQTAQGNTLADKLSWLGRNAVNGRNYIITVTANENLTPQDLSYSDKNISIILKGDTQERTVTLSGNGSLFTINSGVTLILDDNITLKGHDSNDASLVKVHSGGTLEMNDGSKITGNTNNSGNDGGGVTVGWGGGTFNMKGGTISDNVVLSDGSGGGVSVSGSGSTFTMSGGIISGNKAPTWGGGGVRVTFGTFIMEGGLITGNTAQWAGAIDFYARKGEVGKFYKKAVNSGVCEISNNINIQDSVFYVEAYTYYDENNMNAFPKRRYNDILSNEELYYDAITDPPTYRGGWDP